ncbi:hypothetical protein ACFOY4_39915 [Actinomadura syzygii]|uniref:Uncharacterized protein n=1 Tax=Actinomadura syzygii TaxID=1427538 RepID=A0A5D0U9X4_9ACTN|nr:hypothetical protein [Actinomadura syzygii]TYC14526.1 hypothetical protein FXF65_16905 [Actinomadura syzygii]
MRLPRWAPWIEDVLNGSPSVTGVQTFAAAGIKDKPCGHVITLRTGATVALQWVRTAATGGEDQSQPEEPVTGKPSAPVELPDLPASGRIQLSLIEAHVAALIANGGSDEVSSVERTSQRPDSKKCGVNVRMHSGANVYGVFLYTAPAGASFNSGGEYQQREEV